MVRTPCGDPGGERSLQPPGQNPGKISGPAERRPDNPADKQVRGNNAPADGRPHTTRTGGGAKRQRVDAASNPVSRNMLRSKTATAGITC